MSGTLVGIPVVNGETVLFEALGYELILNGSTYVANANAIVHDGTIASSGSPLPVADAAAILNLGSILTQGAAQVGQLESIGAQLAGTLHTSGAVPPLTYLPSTSATVTTTSGPLINAGGYTRSLVLTTDLASTGDVYLDPSGGTAAIKAGVPLAGGGGSVTFGSPDLPIPSGTITAISDSGSVIVSIAGG